jgi:hypothetical protein
MPDSSSRLAVLFAAVLGVACSPAALADDEGFGDTIVAPEALRGAGTNNVPRVTWLDAPTDARRNLPGDRKQLSGASYRWWSSVGRVDLGLGLGAVAYVARPTSGGSPGSTGDGAPVLALASGTVLTLGMRYRTSEGSALFADAAGVRGLAFEGDRVIGKVGLEFQSAQSRWNIAYGGLGLKLSGDTGLAFRLRKGGLGMVMRSSF